MSIRDNEYTNGFDLIDRELQSLPNRLADELQSALVRIMLDHQREVVRSSTFTPQGKRGLSRAMRIRPAPVKAERRQRTRKIKDVVAESYTVWRGDQNVPAREGVARRLERTVGDPYTIPRRRKRLIIPVGDFLTPTGRPRRRRGKQISVRDLDGIEFVRIRGALLVVQHLKAGERGLYESGAKGIRKTKLGARTRIVAVAADRAKTVRGIDWWGAWQRLEGKRAERFGRVLDHVTDKRRAQGRRG